MSDQTPTPDYEAATRVLDANLLEVAGGRLCEEVARLAVDVALEGLMVVPADEPLYRWNSDTAIEEVWLNTRVEPLRQDLIRDGVLVRVTHE